MIGACGREPSPRYCPLSPDDVISDVCAGCWWVEELEAALDEEERESNFTYWDEDEEFFK